MAVDIFLFFDGDCRQAIEHYAKIFRQEFPKQIMTYGENPDGAPEPDAEPEGRRFPPVADSDRIIYACMPLFGNNMMFSDIPSGQEYIQGNNFAVTIGHSDADEVKRIYEELSTGGEVYMPLDKTFFSELFGMVCDRFGIIWQISLT